MDATSIMTPVLCCCAMFIVTMILLLIDVIEMRTLKRRVWILERMTGMSMLDYFVWMDHEASKEIFRTWWDELSLKYAIAEWEFDHNECRALTLRDVL